MHSLIRSTGNRSDTHTGASCTLRRTELRDHVGAAFRKNGAWWFVSIVQFYQPSDLDLMCGGCCHSKSAV